MLEQSAPIIPTIVKGEDKTLTIKLVTKSECSSDCGDPLDISAATQIDCVFINTDGSFLHKLLTTSGVSILNGPGGKFQIFLTATETNLLAMSPSAGYSSIQVTLTIASKKTIINLIDVIQVVSRVFAGA